MPLSEREQKILDEIEKSLATEDPRFASRGTPERSAKVLTKRIRVGVSIFFAGLALLVLFFLSRLLIVGLVAFAGMVAGMVLLASAVSALVKDTTDRTRRDGRTLAGSMSGWEDAVRKRFRRP